jgi:hypothetical protein
MTTSWAKAANLKLHFWMATKGWSYRAMERRTGIPAQTCRRIHANCKVSELTLRRIADYLVEDEEARLPGF